MIVKLEEYRKARVQKLASNPRREEEELLCVNWNPAFSVVALSCFKTPQELSPQLPDDFEGIDMSALIERLQALASQI
jgi:hypothetical protein